MVSRPKLEGRNWLLMPKLRPDPTLLIHLLLAHGSHTQSRNQISISRLKAKPLAGKAPVNRSTKETATPKSLYKEIVS